MTVEGTAPLVSVVLPTYDRPDLVVEATESVAEQTYPNIELIVVDDHSPTPVERPVSEALSDAPIDVQHIRHEENRGGNTARNTGIRAAEGEYVAFLDDDDLWEPIKIERQVETMRRAPPRVGVVCVGQRLVDADGETIRQKMPTTRGEVTTDILGGEVIGAFSTLLVDADVIEEAGLPDERYPRWQDREWCLRLSQCCEFESMAEPLVIRRLGSHDQITDDFDTVREAAALYVGNHRSTAASYGRKHERRFIAAISWNVSRAAIQAEGFGTCIRYSLRAIRNDPFSLQYYFYLAAALGGPFTLKSARWARRRYHELVG